MKRLIRAIVWIAVLALVAFGLRTVYRQYYRAAYPMEYTETVEQCAETYGFAPSLLYAIIYTESRFDPAAVSSADAKGLMQLTDSTLDWAKQRLGQKNKEVDVFDPASNIFYGTTVLSLLSAKFTDEDTLLAAYNAGQGNVARWLADPACSDDGVTLKEIPYTETRNFVARVRETQKQYRQLYGIE